MFTHFSYGQLVTTIDFETEDMGYTPSATTGSGDTDVFNRANPNIGGNATFMWSVEDLPISDPSIELDQINITGSTSFTFSIDMLAHHYNDWDNSDELLITYSVDGGADQNLMWVQSANSGSNEPAALDLDFDGIGDCGVLTTLPSLSTGTADDCASLTNTFETFTTSSIDLTSNSTLDIKLQFNNLTSSDEGIYLDNIIITEVSGSTDPTVTFDTVSSTVNETDIDIVTTGIPVTFSNYTADATITPTVNASSTADAADYTIDLTPLTFSADGTLNIPLTIKDDADFLDETIIIDFTVTSGTADLELSQHTVTITDDELPPSIGFDTATSSETETDATFNVTIPITVSSYSGTQIDISVVASGTAEGGDFTLNTASLSFTADGSQNISLDINDDADTDEETVILTITETSAVTGLVISQNTHTVTITDDEIPPVPAAGVVFITEVLDSEEGFKNDYLELFNNSNESVSLGTTKLIRYTSGGSFDNYVYDFGTDETNASADITIPAYGFLIVARGNSRSDFNTANSITLPVSVNFNSGNQNLFFGTGRRWLLKVGGTADSDDGTLVDDTAVGVGSTKDYRNIFTNTFITGSASEGTPGELEYLLYNGGSWVNSEAMDGTTSASDAYIYGDLTLSSNSTINDIGVDSGGSLNINSGTSLIVNGTSSGNVSYNRNLATTNWYLMSSPVVGETYDDAYVTANNIASGTGDNRGIALFTSSDDSWDYMESGETAPFAEGNGYSVKRSATGDISFTGTLNVADVGVTLSSAGNRFNLLGNPYTSHIASAIFLTGEDAISETQTLWVWNQGTGTSGAYEVKTVADAMVITPAQGFFVKANAAGGIFNFDKSNQFSTGGAFQRTEIRPELYISVSNQTDVREAKIYYIENMTSGFDVGYEGELFNGVTNPLAIYTHLVADSEGKNYQVQSLPTNNYENMIIPVGINAVSGTAISIDASTNNFPDGINIYLEDKQDNNFTLLDADSSFDTTLENDLSGIGRFYLYTTAGTLSTDAFEIHNNVSIYKTSNDNLRIVGVKNGTASIQIYNILGKQMMRTSFEGMGVNDISLPTLPIGVYIIKLATKTGTTNKKIIIQ